jgi:thioredoxin-like negative regulator of GroEL
MSKMIDNRRNLQEVLKSKDGVFVLFYASWCPFSRMFLPVYEKQSQSRKQKFARILIDENGDVCNQYSIDVYPTVIFFKAGQVSKRLDGTPNVGLNEKQLADLINVCDQKKD